jgi:hypothetical protein
LENLNDSKDINRTCENITENIIISTKDSLGLHELKQHKPWFEENCSICLSQRKQGILQWLQHPKDPNQSKLHNLNNVRCEASRHFKNKKKKGLSES